MRYIAKLSPLQLNFRSQKWVCNVSLWIRVKFCLVNSWLCFQKKKVPVFSEWNGSELLYVYRTKNNWIVHATEEFSSPFSVDTERSNQGNSRLDWIGIWVATFQSFIRRDINLLYLLEKRNVIFRVKKTDQLMGCFICKRPKISLSKNSS
jgi:hypothetical protein